MSRFRNAYCKVTAWLELKTYPIQPDGSVAAVHLTMYFDELRTAWHENKNAKEMGPDNKNEIPPLPLPLRALPRREASPGPGFGLGDLRVSGASEKPREGKRIQHGATVGHCAWRGLSFGERKLYLPWDMSNVDIETGVKGRRPDPPIPAEPVTMWMIEQLEIFIADPATPLVAKHLAAAYLFCCYAVMRVEQAQSCWIDAIRDDEFIEGYVFLDKNPKRDKMQPRPWCAPLYGITGSKLYFETLMTSLEGVKDKCYIFRAYESPDGSVKNATGLLPGPLLQTNGLMNSLQEMLRMACGFSLTQSQAYTLHSPRHFLPGVAAARGEPGTCRCEIGRWSLSVAQLPSLRPEVNMIRRHRTRAATLPDLYAKNHATERPLAILTRQMQALRTYYVKCGPGNLPTFGGLKNLTVFAKTKGPHED
jgi:hypothetical protein